MADRSDTKSRIKHAALRLFVAKGVALTTTRELAREAGIAEGTLYRHFETKDDLVRDLFEEHYLAFGRRIDRVQSGAASIGGKLDAIVHDACGLFDTDQTLYRFLLLMLNEVLPQLPSGKDGPVVVVRTMFAEAAASGALVVSDPDLATALFFGLLLQPAMSLIQGGLTPPLGRYAAGIAASCRRALLH